MVSVNVAQLLQAALGSVRQFDFTERLPDATDELHLRGPVSGHARLTRTSRGVLVHSDYSAPVRLECARCLDPANAEVEGSLDEEFLQTTDIRTGLPLHLPREPDQPLIDEHHELDLDETLRQNILTGLPLRPLCEASCPGLCPSCGRRLDRQHTPHPEPIEEVEPTTPASPFARLATLFKEEQEG